MLYKQSVTIVSSEKEKKIKKIGGKISMQTQNSVIAEMTFFLYQEKKKLLYDKSRHYYFFLIGTQRKSTVHSWRKFHVTLFTIKLATRSLDEK